MKTNKKYFKTRKEAVKAAESRKMIYRDSDIHVFKMPKGTRHHGEYFVGDYMQFINLY